MLKTELRGGVTSRNKKHSGANGKPTSIDYLEHPIQYKNFVVLGKDQNAHA
jgi:hypothetical protein